MILGAADYALGKKDAIPPPELSDYFKCELFSSLPNGVGWKNEPYRWLQRVITYTNTYNAICRYKESERLSGEEKAKWIKENKNIMSIFIKVEKLRNDNG